MLTHPHACTAAQDIVHRHVTSKSQRSKRTTATAVDIEGGPIAREADRSKPTLTRVSSSDGREKQKGVGRVKGEEGEWGHCEDSGLSDLSTVSADVLTY